MLITPEIAAREILRRRCETSLAEFARRAWHIVEPATPFIDGWHIDIISECLEAVSRGEIKSLIVNMPPRHMKSMLVCVFWPCWEWTTKPHTRWLFASYAQALSIRDSLKCRRILDSQWYKSLWPDVELLGDQNQKARFENSATGVRVATSVGGSATGVGGNRIVVDDPHKAGHKSDRIRESVIAWWNEEMSTRGNSKESARVIVGQRIHEHDLCGFLLDNSSYEHLCLAAEYDGPRSRLSLDWSDPRTKDGEPLWPARFGREEIDELKTALGSYAASAQLQQRPAPAGGGMLKEDWWRFFDDPPECDEIIQSWDMAFKGGKKGSFVVGQVWGRKGANFYLLDQVRRRMSFPETVSAVRALTVRWERTGCILVEDKANGPAIIDTLKDEIPAILPVTPRDSKIGRLSAVSALIEAGNVYLPNPSKFLWVQDFLTEAASFPVGSQNDQIDSMSQALTRLRESTKVGLYPIRASLVKRRNRGRE